MVIQQNNRKLLMMDILMSETCWAHKKWNKVASDIKLVFLFFNYHNDARSNKHKIDYEICLENFEICNNNTIICIYMKNVAWNSQCLFICS